MFVLSALLRLQRLCSQLQQQNMLIVSIVPVNNGTQVAGTSSIWCRQNSACSSVKLDASKTVPASYPAAATAAWPGGWCSRRRWLMCMNHRNGIGYSNFLIANLHIVIYLKQTPTSSISQQLHQQPPVQQYRAQVAQQQRQDWSGADKKGPRKCSFADISNQIIQFRLKCNSRLPSHFEIIDILLFLLFSRI